MAKFGEHNYDLGRFGQRGLHEISNALYPESNIPLRDHSGLYGSNEKRDVEAPEKNLSGPELEQDEPELEC
jgi:hypothetical protein